MAFARMRLGIGGTAQAADLLGTEPHDADRPARGARIHDPLGRRRSDGDTAGVVDRARSLVPTVKMPADQHDPGRGIAARHLGNDIA